MDPDVDIVSDIEKCIAIGNFVSNTADLFLNALVNSTKIKANMFLPGHTKLSYALTPVREGQLMRFCS